MDQIAYLFSAFKSVGKQLENIYIINVSKKNFENLLKEINIERTPTTIVFNARQEPQVTLVGATFHDLESLMKVRTRIASNMPKGLKLVLFLLYRPALYVMNWWLPKEAPINLQLNAKYAWELIKWITWKISQGWFGWMSTILFVRIIMCDVVFAPISAMIVPHISVTLQEELTYPTNMSPNL